MYRGYMSSPVASSASIVEPFCFYLISVVFYIPIAAQQAVGKTVTIKNLFATTGFLPASDALRNK